MSCRIPRIVEASERGGGERITRLGKEGRTGDQVLSICGRLDGYCERDAQGSGRDYSVIKALEEQVPWLAVRVIFL